MKKVINSFLLSLSILALTLVLSVFCFPMTALSGISGDVQAEASTSTVKQIGTAQELQRFINNYSSSTSNVTIELTANIDMSERTLNYTIGNSSAPFTGTFNGNGYAITNITYENVNTNAGTSTYIGLFGYTSGATISNLQIGGTYSVTDNYCGTDVYAGILVGYAKSTTISMCYINATYSLTLGASGSTPSAGNFEFNFNELSYGAIAGTLVDSSADCCIVSPTLATSFTLLSRNTAVSYLGGVVGNLNNSSLTFIVATTSMSVTIASNYTSGTAYIGGFVGIISQQNSIIRNSVITPSLSVSNLGGITENVGILGGYIGVSLPSKMNISYTYYYAPNLTYSIFNNITSYLSTYSLTSTATLYISALNSGLQSQSAFDNLSWYRGGYWNFDDIWYMSGSSIALQTFKMDYSIAVQLDSSTSASESVLAFLTSGGYLVYSKTSLSEYSICTSLPQDDGTLYYYNENLNDKYVEAEEYESQTLSSLRYGGSVSFSFTFNTTASLDGAEFSNYYELSTLALGNSKVATFSRTSTGEYSASVDEEAYPGITITCANNVFTVTIESMTARYTGTYSISIEPIEFTGSFIYNLYNEGTLVDEEPKTECYVTYTGGGNRSDTSITISSLTYGTQVSVTTDTNSNSIYMFTGWYLEGNDGSAVMLSSSNNLSITFGENGLTGDFTIYARYDDNARVLTFSLGEGISRLEVSTSASTYTIDEDTSISLPREYNTMTIVVYEEEGYVFDYQVLVDKINTYKTSTASEDICTAEYKIDDETGESYYVLTINLEYLNSDSVNGFIMEFYTDAEDGVNWGRILLIVGICIAVIAAIVAVVVVVIIIRRRGGGYGGGGKAMKSSYKSMYY